MNNRPLKLLCVIALAVMMMVSCACAQISVSSLTAAEQTKYEAVQQRIDEGACVDIAMMLVDGEISHTLFALLMQQDGELMEIILADALTEMSRRGDLEYIAALRQNGYVSDECMRAYWQMAGVEEPQEQFFRAEAIAVDDLLVHELTSAFERDPYALRSLNNMVTAGMIAEDMHTALIQAFGFDYTDIVYLDEHGIAPMRVLMPDEKEIYEQVMSAIDEGDSKAVTRMMLFGEISEQTYLLLMQQDADVMDFVIAQSLAQFAREGSVENVIRLRVNGFVSDACFEYYWETIGCSLPAAGGADDVSGTDPHLLHELVQISERYANGVEILRWCWNSGLIGDQMHGALVERLGFNYTQE